MTTMIGYLRVSTEEQAASGLGLEAQRDTITRYAASHG
ncbi:recombinase family protein [Microbacterium sulfonylureivorans]|nr:recombinase family protein [Microbacterium sulfonylureivorans]